MTYVEPEAAATIPAPRAGAEQAGRAAARIVALDCFDVRFPTSIEHDGSDAMNPDPDYSAAYAVLRTDVDGLEGHALSFTIGRGNEVVVAAIAALRSHVVGRSVSEVAGDLGGFSAALINDSQLRWLGPEKGVMHMAIGAVVNAAWDLAAKLAGQPVWRLLADMSPEQIVGAGRLPLHRRRADPGRGAGHPARRPGGAGTSGSPSSSGTAIPPTRPRRAGSATPTSGWCSCPGRPSRTASPRSS